MTRAAPAPLAACAAWVCACSTPTPQIVLGLAAPPVCPFDTCAMLLLPCDAVMSIRIVEPGDVSRRYLDQCVTVPRNKGNNVCALNMIDLEDKPLPVRDLAVQIAVFPLSAVQVDPDSGALTCPEVAYSANGLPITQAKAPVYGRQAFYHPGDSIVDVTLGCTDLSAIQAGDSCSNPSAGAATATVLGFDTQVPVPVGPGGIADELFVWSGEPHIFDGSYVLPPPDLVEMKLDDNGTPHWTAKAAQTFDGYACVEVLENAAQAVATLHCAPAAEAAAELTGYWISDRVLQPILKTAASVLGSSGLPGPGLTIGVVVDASSARGVQNVAVQINGPGHITYLSGDGTIGRDATFASGVFVSDDVPFGTTFFAPGARPAIGGLVAGKATIVVLTMGSPTH
ncbi:MAG TPA: hypothetical protein VF516_22350 [Kofleriaceae bacterium]